MSFPTTYEAEFAQVAAAAVPVADAIIIFRALCAYHLSLGEVYGSNLTATLLEAARDDMWAAMQANYEGSLATLEADLEDAKQLAATAKQFRKALPTEETGVIDIVTLNSTESHVTDTQELVDDFDLPRYHASRANVPLMWLLPVRQAVEMQARHALSEDDRLMAADLQGRTQSSPYVEQVTAALAATVIAEEALVQ